MKLAFVGNMNNMPLVYARELRKMGHDVDFYVDAPRSDALNRPERRYPEYACYPDWMIEHRVPLSLLSYGWAEPLLASLIRRVNAGGYDGIVLNGASISLGTHLHAPKFAILGGADLDVLCDPGTANLKKLVESFGLRWGVIRYTIYRRFVAQQRKGLRACSGYNYFPEGVQPRGEELLAEIFENLSPYRLPLRGADISQQLYVEPSDRRGDDTIILVPVRFLWREPLPAGFSPHENKRNDIIIRGLADYMRTSGRSPNIVLVEKGPDVKATKDLAAELGIGSKLTWLKEMGMREIFDWYARADIVFDQLGEHVMGAVTLDAMLTGRPVITNARPEIFDRIIADPSPICHARSPQAVSEWLHRLVDAPDLRRDIGKRSRTFVQRNFSAVQTARAIEAHFLSIGKD